MERDAYNVSEFCEAHSISRGTYYNLRKDGLTPKEMKISKAGVRISREAAAEWRREMESRRSESTSDFSR